MESLNLNTLANSLPSQQKAEQELLNNFKAAALSITTLYRSSRQSSKRAYNAGYAAACQDLLTMIQQGVSVGGLGSASGSSQQDNDGLTIGRVMDWTEARLEAIRAQEEEEDEEEERENQKERSRAAPPAPSTNKPVVPPQTSSNISASLLTPNSPVLTSTHPPEPTTPSPPLLPVNSLRMLHRSKPRISMKGETSAPYPSFPSIPSSSVFNFNPETAANPPIPFPETPIPAVGTKRRHAMMMMLDAASPVTTGNPSASQSPTSLSSSPTIQPNTSTARRRTKSSRGSQQLQNQNINIIQSPTEAMDIEDEGRERKRVARR